MRVFSKWKTTLKVEKEFLRSLDVIVKLFVKIANNADGDIEKYRRQMNNFQNSYQYERYITSIVKNMVTPIEVQNERTWREAARKSTRGRFLYNLLMEELKQGAGLRIQDQIIENAALIRTLPNDVANKVVKNIEEEALRGERATTIAKIISSETSKHASASARLIARTEVSKTTTALTKARSEELDLHWYVWRTALDGDRVRKSHRNMEDVLVNWNEPPSPEELVGEKSVGHYHAGNIWNCRCYPEPLIDVDLVKWPHKVYHNGVITRMNKGDFLKII